MKKSFQRTRKEAPKVIHAYRKKKVLGRASSSQPGPKKERKTETRSFTNQLRKNHNVVNDQRKNKRAMTKSLSLVLRGE